MSRKRLVAVLAILVAAAAGYAWAKVISDHDPNADFSSYKTYGWLHRGDADNELQLPDHLRMRLQAGHRRRSRRKGIGARTGAASDRSLLDLPLQRQRGICGRLRGLQRLSAVGLRLLGRIWWWLYPGPHVHGRDPGVGHRRCPNPQARVDGIGIEGSSERQSSGQVESRNRSPSF